MRVRALLSVALTTLCAAALPLSAAADPAVTAGPAASDVTVDGTVRVLVVDPTDRSAGAVAAPGATEDHRAVLETDSGSFFLDGAPGAANSRVRVSGSISGDTLTASAVTPLPTARIAGGLPTEGSTRVLVMMAYWTEPDSVTPAAAREQIFSDADAWYRDVSYGRLGLTGDVTPWMRIAGPTTGCYADYASLMDQARAAALSRGYDAATYDNLVLYFPYCTGDSGGFAGWGYVGSPGTWINGFFDRGTLVHELGHNYGLSHAHSYLCSGGGLTGSCTSDEYGDPFDAMGSSYYVGHFSAAQKTQLGWMTGRTKDLSAGGSVTLVPMADDSTSPHTATITTASGRTYWLEYRQPLDFDSSITGEGADGVLVHATGPGSGSSDPGPTLLDVSTDDGIGTSTATLRSGRSWTTDEGMTVTVGAVGPGGATVTVTRATAPGAPTAVTATTDTTARTATITWKPPTTTGGSPITGYRVARTGTDTKGIGPWTTTVPATTRTQSFINLKTATPYTLSVHAINANGTSTPTTATITLR